MNCIACNKIVTVANSGEFEFLEELSSSLICKAGYGCQQYSPMPQYKAEEKGVECFTKFAYRDCQIEIKEKVEFKGQKRWVTYQYTVRVKGRTYPKFGIHSYQKAQHQAEELIDQLLEKSL